MVSYLQNWEVYSSLSFYVLAKFLSYFAEHRTFSFMYNSKKTALFSIPENNEVEDDNLTIKWVPKKKHEVLKAKYKCLKKLFQIYDASLIGMLPGGLNQGDDRDGQLSDPSEETTHRRKRRSNRTKTDALVGTTEESSGDVTEETQSHQSSTATTAEDINDTPITSATQVENTPSQATTNSTKEICYASTQDSRDTLVKVQSMKTVSSQDCGCVSAASAIHKTPAMMPRHMPQPPMKYYGYERRKTTRFQNFINRIFGIRRERPVRPYVHPNNHIYAASDYNLAHNYGEKRRRRGIRFRRARRPRKMHSESSIGDMNSPGILDYVQSVQKSCLLDTTPRQCPIVGCRMIFYGIINYNDHLNLCHFPDRKYICHYCHEGFETEELRIVHENEHLGLNKLNATGAGVSTTKLGNKATCNVQTEKLLNEDKLNKIVSFIDKIVDTDLILNEMQKNRYSDTNIGDTQSTLPSSNTTTTNKRTTSLTNTCETKTLTRPVNTSESYVEAKCHFCGETFDNHKQMNLHINSEHRAHDKFSKFHSCACIVNVPKKKIDLISRDGQIRVESLGRGCCSMVQSISSTTSHTLTARRSEESLLHAHNTTAYSTESLSKRPSALSNILSKVKCTMYKWEPGTKIIHV